MIKYTFNMNVQQKQALEQFSRVSDLKVCEIVRLAVDYYLSLPDVDLGFCKRK